MSAIVYSRHVPFSYFAVPKVFCEKGKAAVTNKVVKNISWVFFLLQCETTTSLDIFLFTYPVILTSAAFLLLFFCPFLQGVAIWRSPCFDMPQALCWKY